MRLAVTMPFYQDAFFWVQVALTLVTGSLFWATFKVAARTKSLAEDTVAATRQADQHHQESLRPIVQWLGRATLRPKGLQVSGSEPTAYLLSYGGDIANVGTGPALNIEAAFVFQGSLVFNRSNQKETHLPGLGPGEKRSWQFVQELKAGAIAGATPEHPVPFKLTLTYENVFGQSARTEHTNEGADYDTQTHHTPPAVTPRSSARLRS